MNKLAPDEPLDRAVQLFDLGTASARADRLGDAVLCVVREQQQGDTVQSRFGGPDLGQNVDAVPVGLDHLLDTPDLAFHPTKPGLDLFLVSGVAGHGYGLYP